MKLRFPRLAVILLIAAFLVLFTGWWPISLVLVFAAAFFDHGGSYRV